MWGKRIVVWPRTLHATYNQYSLDWVARYCSWSIALTPDKNLATAVALHLQPEICLCIFGDISLQSGTSLKPQNEEELMNGRRRPNRIGHSLQKTLKPWENIQIIHVDLIQRVSGGTSQRYERVFIPWENTQTQCNVKSLGWLLELPGALTVFTGSQVPFIHIQIKFRPTSALKTT